MQGNLVPVIVEVSQALLILDIFGDRRLSSVYMQNFNAMLGKVPTPEHSSVEHVNLCSDVTTVVSGAENSLICQLT